MKLTIYHGASQPFKAVGKNQCNLLDFAFNYPTWHSFKDDKETLNAVNTLVKNKVIVLNKFNQFK